MNNETSKSALNQLDDEVIAVISAAITELGYSASQIASIRPTVSHTWKMVGRMLGR